MSNTILTGGRCHKFRETMRKLNSDSSLQTDFPFSLDKYVQIIKENVKYLSNSKIAFLGIKK